MLPKSKTQKKYARSKARLKEEVQVHKGREADLWDEVTRLRGLATAVREFLEGDLGTRSGSVKLHIAAEKALLFENGPGVNAHLARERSDRVKVKRAEGEVVRSKDPFTERRYQEDQAVLRQDGRVSFSAGDEVEPV